MQGRALRQRLFLQIGALARTAGIVETGDGDIDAMNEWLITITVIYIAVMITISVMLDIVAQHAANQRRTEYISSITRLSNLLAERIDNNDGK